MGAIDNLNRIKKIKGIMLLQKYINRVSIMKSDGKGEIKGKCIL